MPFPRLLSAHLAKTSSALGRDCPHGPSPLDNPQAEGPWTINLRSLWNTYKQNPSAPRFSHFLRGSRFSKKNWIYIYIDIEIQIDIDISNIIYNNHILFQSIIAISICFAYLLISSLGWHTPKQDLDGSRLSYLLGGLPAPKRSKLPPGFTTKYYF